MVAPHPSASSGLPLLVCFCQLLILLLLPGSLAIRLNMGRAEALSVYGLQETRLYFDSCDQSSQRSSCVFAIDSSVSQEPTQCAVTDPEDGPWWLAVLETPAYVTKVVVLNMDYTYRSFQDGLTKIVVMAGDDICFSYDSSEQFVKRTFPCDSLTDQITIRSSLLFAVLAVCDVEVYGAALNFSTVRGTDQFLSASSCQMSSTDGSGYCENAVDGKTSLDHTASPCAVTTVEQKPWLEVTLSQPALVNDIHVFSRSDIANQAISHFTLTLNERRCAEYNGELFTSGSFKCRYFGDRLRLQSELEMASLSVCEIKFFGHVLTLDLPPKFKPLGCHKDNMFDRDMTQLVSSITMSPIKCHRMCKRLGLKHFALQSGYHCFCGNAFGRHGAADNKTCSIQCDGNPEEICGGEGVSSVFEIL